MKGSTGIVSLVIVLQFCTSIKKEPAWKPKSFWCCIVQSLFEQLEMTQSIANGYFNSELFCSEKPPRGLMVPQKTIHGWKASPILEYEWIV